MGSKSSQKSSSSNASSSIGFGGDNAGIVGNGNSQTEDYSSTDNSMSYEDNSYLDTSSTDNSYTDNSKSYEDNSYLDSSIDGDFNNNTGTVNILDGGAIEVARQIASDSLSAVAIAMDSAAAFGSRSLDTANFAIEQNALVSGNAMALMGKTAESSMLHSQMSNEVIRDTAATALEEMSDVVFSMKEQAESTVLSSTQANQKALETTAKLMTTMNQNGNDLLIDGVVNMVKYGAIAAGSLGLVFGLVKLVGGKK